MSYTPPLYNAVNFDDAGPSVPYVPPPYYNVVFDDNPLPPSLIPWIMFQAVVPQ